MTLLRALTQETARLGAEAVRGRVSAVQGLSLTATGLPLPVGARCCILPQRSAPRAAQVVGVEGGLTLLSVLGDVAGLAPGDPILSLPDSGDVPVGWELLGRVINADGQPLDGRGLPALTRRYRLHAPPPPPLERRPIDAPLGLGVRAIDALLTAGRGQRLGIFAGTGVGKSVLMGMICRHTQADVVVACLVGERGREVGDFVSKQLGAGLQRSVVVACTSDEAPALRVRACFHATAIAEFFRDQGLNVLLLMDSVTRMAMAQRQLGLAAGEPPTAKGYPPSVFALLPRLLERAGPTRTGSITGIYTVLVEAGDIDEPLADAVRGILDGHIWLSRSLAGRGHYPAIDILSSISRLADDVVDAEHRRSAQRVRGVLATWNDIEDLVNLGAYVPGASRAYDLAFKTRDAVLALLQQPRDATLPFEASSAELKELGRLLDATAADLERR